MLPSSNDIFDIFPANRVPIIINSPHSGQKIPDYIAKIMTPEGLQLPDTDLFVDELYSFAPDLGICLVRAKFSRYVVDLNRPLPGGDVLYPGQRVDSSVCPQRTFRGQAIYRDNISLDRAEIDYRIERFYKPYYDALKALITNLLNRFSKILLFDAHSISSELPDFPGSPFPDFILGNRHGQTCPQELLDIAADQLGSNNFSVSLNEPFQGGQITRYFGEWNPRVYSFQLEMSQRLYLDEITGQKSNDFQKVSVLLQSLLERFSKYMIKVENQK